MKTTSMPSRVLAMLAGAVFLSGTVAIMFEDVILRAAPLALKHWVALTLLAGTIFAGHLADVARQSRQWLTATAFVVVFLSGSALIVYLSAGRQADATIQTTAQINDDAERRIEISAARRRAQKMLEKAQGELASECKTGRGTRCDGIKTTIAVYEAALGGHDAALDRLGAPRVASPEAEQFSEVMAVVFGADKARVKAAAVLLMPLAMTLFLELGTIVSFGYASRSGRARKPAEVVAATETRVQLPAPTDPDHNDVPFGEPKSKRECLADLLTLTALGRDIPSQEHLRERWGMAHKGTVSRWLSEWENQGLITRVQSDRCKVITS